MKILITGIAGLIGSNFADYILNCKKDITIVGIDNLSGGYKSNIDEKIIFYQEDLLNFDKIEDIFDIHKFDYVFHFGAYAAECLSPFIRRFNYQNNLLSTTNLVNLSIKYKIKRFIFTSSVAVYGFGNNDNEPFNEEKTSKNPIDPYGVAKLACEMDIKIASVQHNLDYCILRPHNVYGKKQNIWDMYRNVLGIWMYQILNNEDICIYGDGEQTRAFTYIDDIMEPIWQSAVSNESKNQEINLGGIKEIKLKDAALTLLKITKTTQTLKFLEKRHEVKHVNCDYIKSVNLLNYKMITNLEEGLTIMWKWVKTQPKKNRNKWNKYELDIGMYSYWK